MLSLVPFQCFCRPSWSTQSLLRLLCALVHGPRALPHVLCDLAQPDDGLGAARQRPAHDLSLPAGEPTEGDIAPQRQRS